MPLPEPHEATYWPLYNDFEDFYYIDEHIVVLGGFSCLTSGGYNLAFPFSGVYIQVVGIVIPWIGGDKLATAFFDVNGAHGALVQVKNWTGPTTLYDVPFYTVSGLVYGTDNQNTLTINVTDASPDNPFILNYLVVGLPSNDIGMDRVSSVSLPTPAVTTLGVNIAATTVRATPTDQSSGASSARGGMPTKTASRSQHASFPLAPILGALAGGIVFLAILLGSLCYLTKRHKRLYGGDDDVAAGDIASKALGSGPAETSVLGAISNSTVSQIGHGLPEHSGGFASESIPAVASSPSGDHPGPSAPLAKDAALNQSAVVRATLLREGQNPQRALPMIAQSIASLHGGSQAAAASGSGIRNTLGGVLEYDGKEARLSSGHNTDAANAAVASSSSGREDPEGTQDTDLSPPAYEP
ncbi:hypothetical protein PYCCODRAFT_1465189 [Trametes coccinea BRFM310]|uniref:Uncharacterized protein n=1 Tax=Trametes coccinea (strain BRFM310) TaxID=1353009 RepID=A0A1Y2IXB7_TRAC3|nr:hypothetical protein PYCCODRAFT_1465189 [Trametes coccinea BRFM310]